MVFSVMMEKENSVIKKLWDSFAPCKRPSDENLISCVGIEWPDAMEYFNRTDRSEFLEKTDIDCVTADFFNYLSSDGRRYFFPAVFEKIASNYETLDPFAIELLLGWVRHSIKPNRGTKSCGISLSEKQINAIYEVVYLIFDTVALSNKGGDIYRNRYIGILKDIEFLLKHAGEIEDFDK